MTDTKTTTMTTEDDDVDDDEDTYFTYLRKYKIQFITNTNKMTLNWNKPNVGCVYTIVYYLLYTYIYESYQTNILFTIIVIIFLCLSLESSLLLDIYLNSIYVLFHSCTLIPTTPLKS